MAVMKTGQLYQAEVVIELKDTNAIERSCFVLVAESQKDVERRIRYMLDNPNYADFAIVTVRRIKTMFRAWSRVIFRDEAGRPIDREDNRHRFGVGISGQVMANDERHCRRKIGHWLLDDAPPSTSPLGRAGQLIIEDQGKPDRTKTHSADRTGGEHLHGRPLPGGAPGGGKKR